MTGPFVSNLLSLLYTLFYPFLNPSFISHSFLSHQNLTQNASQEKPIDFYMPVGGGNAPFCFLLPKEKEKKGEEKGMKNSGEKMEKNRQ